MTTPIDYASNRLGAKRHFGETLGRLATVAALVATVLPLWSLVPMWTVPAGTTIRPMQQASALILGTAAGIFFVAPCALASLALSWRATGPFRWSLYATLGAACSIVVCPAVFITTLHLRNLTLAD